MKVVLITALNNIFDRELADIFAREGCKVYAVGGQRVEGVTLLPLDLKEAVSAVKNESGYIDLYIDTSDERSTADNFNVRSCIDDKIMKELYDANVTRPMALLEAFLPLLEEGEGKHLCYISSAQASINETRGVDGLGYKMAKAALHNFLQITRNALAPKGYTLRAFDPMCNDFSANSETLENGEISAQEAAQAAFNYFTRRRGIERGDARRDDEGNLVLRDAYGRQHSW
jgi:NAD(P)-dependent dehydrogenase (short-subunit alcohol dehydrogenase family)